MIKSYSVRDSRVVLVKFFILFATLRETVDLCRKAESAGASWIAVHGRTTEQRHQPVNYEAIKLVSEKAMLDGSEFSFRHLSVEQSISNVKMFQHFARVFDT